MMQRTRVAIFGGGIAALTAAFELTEQDPEQTRYDIAIYTLGWRLGGKCLVGRDAHRDCRALEHGLHVWAGFYDNSFDLVQRLYARLGRPNDEWREKFEGLNHFTAMELVDGVWKPWLLSARPNARDPGIDGNGGFAPVTLLRTLLTWVEESFLNSPLAQFLEPNAQVSMHREIAAVMGVPHDVVFPTPLSAIAALLDRSAAEPAKIEAGDRDRLVGAFRRQVTSAVGAAPDGDEARRFDILYDLAGGLIQGLLSADVLSSGFDAIDDLEWSAWMKQNGCRQDSLESAIVRGCYDYVFGYVKGIREVSAGVGTLALLRLLLTHKGSIFYTLREPMADFLFAPLYKYLCGRKVKFNFFHRLDALHLSSDGSRIERVALSRQVDLKDPRAEYEPLIDVPGRDFKSWPIHPDYSQIKNGHLLEGHDLESAWTDWAGTNNEVTLRLRSPDVQGSAIDTFDIAILGTGFGGLHSICHELRDFYPDTWGRCLDEVKTTQTLAVQLWLNKETAQLGWHDPGTVLVGFGDERRDWSHSPLQSWQDNTPLLAAEYAGGGRIARSLAYFVGVFPDAEVIPPPSPYPQFPKAEIERAKAAIVPWMNRQLPVLWPNARDACGSGFNWGLLQAPPGTAGAARLDAQYVRVNINPWERYVLSTPGSLRSRLWPDGTGVSNLFLAGDWVRTGLDAGCIEAAVMSGRATARAITGGSMSIPGFGNSGRIPIPVTLLPVVSLLKQLKAGAAGGVGSMEGYCVTIWRDSDAVQRLLPAGLALDPPLGLGPEASSRRRHPIVFLFSRQKNVRPGFVPIGGMRYHEVIELIPFVKQNSINAPSGGPFNYMPHLFLDEIAPVWIGVNLYGFNKRLARITSRDGSFQVQCDLGEIGTDLSERGLPGQAANPRFSRLKSVRRLLEHPLISLTTSGAFVYSHLDFRFDSATFQGAYGQVGLGAPFDPEPCPTGTLDIPSIVDEDFGAFRFQTNWHLSVPLSAGIEPASVVPPDLQAFAATLLSRRRP
ncbi:NAD(P)-binding protein [Chelatococcus reniformis]|uniref:Amine oxidase domain-containing protein n=1 Tax=Chelatococcus reniformis TaxID=1494448 RepID=A0A916X9G2_9HYPH|nr:NAD(P)-binding protein [Chelatococcus reniformis]GGC54489.1 hypothetical protein GCM10010994_11810 [Chelatococcus reniformis]